MYYVHTLVFSPMLLRALSSEMTSFATLYRIYFLCLHTLPYNVRGTKDIYTAIAISTCTCVVCVLLHSSKCVSANVLLLISSHTFPNLTSLCVLEVTYSSNIALLHSTYSCQQLEKDVSTMVIFKHQRLPCILYERYSC